MKKIKLFTLAIMAMLSTNAFAAIDTEATVGIWKIRYDAAAPTTTGEIVGFKNDITATEVKDLEIPNTLKDTENDKTVTIVRVGHSTTPAPLSTVVMEAIETIDFTKATALTTIGQDAFQDATALTSVKFGGALTTIETGAFNGATSLATIDFSAAVKLAKIEDYAFGGAIATTLDFSKCAALTDFTGAGTVSAPFLAAAGTMNSYVTTVTLHAETTKIGTAFAYMNLLTTINLTGTKLSEIVTDAFKADASLTALATPATVTSITGSPFDGCIRLATLTIDATALATFGTAGTNLYGATANSLKALKSLSLTNDIKAGAAINKCLSGCTALKTVNIAVGKEIKATATLTAASIDVCENAEITLGKLSVSPAGLFKGPGATKKIKSLTVGEINVDLSAVATAIVTTAIIETATVGKIGNGFKLDVLGQAETIAFTGEIATALTAPTNANDALTTINFGTVKMSAGADAVPATAFDGTNAKNLTKVTWNPADADVAAGVKVFNIKAFGAASVGAAAKVTLSTSAKVAALYGNDESQLNNVNFGSAGVTTTKLEPKNGVSGATSFYAKFYAAAGKYTIDKTNGDATVVCYEAYVDASDANIYMLPMSIIDGKYYLKALNPVIVKSTSTDEIEASKCNASDEADVTLNSQNFKQLTTGPDTYGKKNEIQYTDAIAGASLMADVDKSYYALAKFEKYGLLWKTFKTTTQLPDCTFYVVTDASAADRLNIIWLDEDNATAIQSFKKKVEAGQIYNLRGEKVNASYKGIVIKDGKKYIQK